MNSVMAAGRGLVSNSYATVQGGLWLVRNDASVTVSPAHAANTSGNPRIDALGVRVYDSETGGDSSDTTTPLPITGTASVSASLTLSSLNLSGAPGHSGGPALPNNFLLMAYALVPNGALAAASFTYLNIAPVAAPPLEIVSASSNMMLVGGTRTVAGAGNNVYLPVNAIAGTQVEVQAGAGVSGTSPVTVRTFGATINGAGLSATSFVLGTPYASATLVFDGTAWEIRCGRQDTGWLPLTLAAGMNVAGGYTPSVRLVGDGVQLKGVLQNESGGTVGGIGSTIATINQASLCPSATVYPCVGLPNSTASATAQVTTAGLISINGSLGNTSFLAFDGSSYTLS
jgi:hypothetical protein